MNGIPIRLYNAGFSPWICERRSGVVGVVEEG